MSSQEKERRVQKILQEGFMGQAWKRHMSSLPIVH
jgi:hypothetical protein